MIFHGRKDSTSRITVASEVVRSRPKGAITNAGWNAFFTLWSSIISFFITPLLIYYLGVEQYGILLLIWSITGILGIMNFGLGEATLRYVAYHYGDRNLPGINRVFGSTLSFYGVVCVVVSVVLLAATPFIITFLKIPAGHHRLVGWMLRITALVFSLVVITQAFGSIPMAFQRYDISSKINIGQSVVRSAGYILLVILKFGILHLILWDVVTYVSTLCVQVTVIRRVFPEVRLLPSFSFRGLREILGYSLFSFLTYCFYTMFRQSGKLVLGRYIGPSSIAYYGTPDNVTQRIHVLVASSSETLLPRFSANRDPEVAQALYLSGTWAALSASIVLFIPLVVLMPDFLRLWINPDFAHESAAVGQLLALSYISQGAFAPAATFFRGTGKPWFVSAALFLAGIGTLVFSVVLVSEYGLRGVGYAYLLGSVAHFLGMLCGWFFLFGTSSITRLMRAVGLPLFLGGIAFALESITRGRFVEVTWFGLFGLGGLFAGTTGLLIFGVDWVLGGESHSKALLERIENSDKLRSMLKYFPNRVMD